MAETFAFWRTIARHFKGHKQPRFTSFSMSRPCTSTSSDGCPGTSGREQTKTDQRDSRIRQGERSPVAGFDWAYDLTPSGSTLWRRRDRLRTHPYRTTDKHGSRNGKRISDLRRSIPRHRDRNRVYKRQGGMADNEAYGKAIVGYLEGRG